MNGANADNDGQDNATIELESVRKCRRLISDNRIAFIYLAVGNTHPEKLISHRYELENIVDGFEVVRDKREVYGKVMMELVI